MTFKKLISIFIVFGIIAGMSGAYYPYEEKDDETVRLKNAICVVVDLVKSLMSAVFLILIVLSAIIYGAGQILGAETRARANVWATSMFLGAIIGGLIYLVVPLFMNEIMGEDVTVACAE
ncbi:MAG: hypothetical protein WC501_02130 [Candidatus Micrarchaeia archaeon]